MGMTWKRTQSSIQFLADDHRNKMILQNAVKSIVGSYEVKMVDENFFTAVEFYLDLNLSPQERHCQIREIMEAVEKARQFCQ
jgi:hypothetical protein